MLIKLGPLCAQFKGFVLYRGVKVQLNRVFENLLTFQAIKLTASTMVGWTISLPGKTPQVTAFGPSEWVLVRRSPRLLMT